MVRISELPVRFAARRTAELARGRASGRAVFVAFVDAATVDVADWSPADGEADRVMCEIDAQGSPINLHLTRQMDHDDENGDWAFTANFNVPLLFEHPLDVPTTYECVFPGDEGARTFEALLAWMERHPVLGALMELTPGHVDAYLDGERVMTDGSARRTDRSDL